MQDTVYVIWVATTPEKLWTALTSPESSPLYFFGRRVESDWNVGAPFVLRMPDGKVDSQGRVLESNPPLRLSMTWHVEWLEEYKKLPPVIVTFQIDPVGDACRLTMTESHPQPIEEKYLENGRKGWPVVLSGLKTLLETGRAFPKVDPSK